MNKLKRYILVITLTIVALFGAFFIVDVFIGVPQCDAIFGSRGVQSYYTFDADDITDDYGSNDGTLVGDTEAVDGQVDRAMEFDGLGDYIAVNSVFGLQGKTNDMSVSMWVYIDNVSQSGAFIKIGRGQSANGDISLNNGFGIGVGGFDFHSSNGNDLIFLYEGTQWRDSNDPIGTGWHHIAVVFEASTVVNAYVDGVNTYTTNNSTLRAIQAGNTTGIGGYTNGNGGPFREFDGIIDEVAIFNRALTPTEITVIYDKSSKGHGYCTIPTVEIVISWFVGLFD